MLSSRLGRSVLALAVIAALLALGVLAWFVVRGHLARGLERAHKTKVEAPGESRTGLSTESQPLESRSAEKGEAGVASAPNGTGTGTLRIRVLDEKARAPVPALSFIVYCERGSGKTLATGSTDKDGRAELRDIEATTVIVTTDRKPPYAEQTGAVWLKPGATKELELLVGPGGSFVGRVVDDLGHVVGGAGVRVEGQKDEEVPETRSGADGRFRVDCLASRPHGIWVVDGEMRPEHWAVVGVSVHLGLMSGGGVATPAPGKEVELGDILLSRASSYAGRVLDATDRPIDGALVSMLGYSAVGPADAGFQLCPGQALTSGGGQFELANVPALRQVVVWTREGQHQVLPVPIAKPGERLEGIELRLSLELALELELVDKSGARAAVPAPETSTDGALLAHRPQFRDRPGDNLSVNLRCADGATKYARAEHADPDGKWRLQLAIDPQSVSEIEINATGYSQVVEWSESGYPALVQRRLELTPLPTFRVRLVRKESAKLPEGEGVRVQVQVCMADPAHHVLAGGLCCGFGSSWASMWKGEAQELVLPVRRNAPFWIYARGPRVDGRASSLTGIAYLGDMRPSGGLADVACMGPFEPGPEARELALDPASFAGTNGAQEPQKPPEPSVPGDPPVVSARIHVVDARTGKPLPTASLEIGRMNANADENGDVKFEQRGAGTFPARVVAHGYALADLGERTLRENEPLDLGTVALEPRARHQGRVLDANGAPLPRVWLGIVSSGPPGEGENSGLGAQPDGRFELLGDLGSSFVLQVVVPAMHDGKGAETMRFALDPWPAEEVKEIRLPHCRKVVVTVGGADAQESQLAPYVCPAHGEATATCDHATDHVPMHAELARGFPISSSAQGQRYAFLLAPGRYVFWGSNLLHELPLTELEVTQGDTDLELTITAH